MTETGMPTPIPLADLNYANGRPGTRARLKQEFADFQVDEELGFKLTGSGEHLYLRVRKTDLGTTEAARQLARAAGVTLRDVGYSGMKDRRGQCSQWFSVRLPDADERALAEFENAQLTVLECQRNQRKLKIGSHRRNHFALRLRHCSGAREEFEQRLEGIASQGVPNFFGAQRFGRDMSNIYQVAALMDPSRPPDRRGGRQRRGMLLSAARAYLFNQVLSARLGQSNWCSYVDGDILNLDGTDRYFVPEAGEWDQALQERLDSFDIHISGPLTGRVSSKDRYTPQRQAADIEKAVLAEFPRLRDGLIEQGLQAARRPLRFRVQDLNWRWLDGETTELPQLQLGFALPRGAYATSVLRELCITEQGDDNNKRQAKHERQE